MGSDLLRRSADVALESTIVGSFTKLGPSVRRHLWAWEDLPEAALDGKTVVVTGGTSGLGREIARGVARAGATVVVVGRSRDRGTEVATELREQGSPARFLEADLSDLAAVEHLAEELVGHHPHLHALVHNAGALLDQRQESPQGLEVTWATMVVAPHLLTRRLAGVTDRVIWMSSGGMYLQSVDLSDWSWQRRDWNGSRAYAQAKRAQIDLVAEATERSEPPLQVAMHPGWADTPGVDAALPGFRKAMGPLLRDAPDGADTAVWLCGTESEDLEPGAFYLDRRPRNTVRWPGTGTSTEDRRKLRALVDDQAGLG